jgi:hypothetical protein
MRVEINQRFYHSCKGLLCRSILNLNQLLASFVQRSIMRHSPKF